MSGDGGATKRAAVWSCQPTKAAPAGSVGANEARGTDDQIRGEMEGRENIVPGCDMEEEVCIGRVGERERERVAQR